MQLSWEAGRWGGEEQHGDALHVSRVFYIAIGRGKHTGGSHIGETLCDGSKGQREEEA